MNAPVIEFYFDIASPYSYLASAQVGDLSERLGCEVRWRPLLLGGVFKATGNVPPATLPQRAAYMLRDLHRWAAVYGVPLTLPPSFPGNSLLAMRVLTAVDSERGQHALRDAARALFERHWANGGDIATEDDVRAALPGDSFDVEALLTQANSPELKQRLRQTTDEAVSRGVFGVPTFFVGEHMFFGNDRLMLLEATYPDGVPSARLIAPTEGPLTMTENS